MARTFCLMMMAVVVSVGCGDDKTTKSSDGNAGGKSELVLSTKSLPKDLPDDIPIYPDARPVHIGSATGTFQTPQTSIRLETTDSVEKVRAFYLKKLKDHAWTTNPDFPLESAKKGKRYLRVKVVEYPKRPGTVMISILFNRPAD